MISSARWILVNSKYMKRKSKAGQNNSFHNKVIVVLQVSTMKCDMMLTARPAIVVVGQI